MKKYAAANNIEIPEEGLFISHGFAIPVLIALAVGVAMTFIATRTKFGRYVFAIGGNPEAAELAGINTKKMTMLIFALMGGADRHIRRYRQRAAQLGNQRTGAAG